MADTKPLVKQGWLRAVIYFVLVFFVVMALQSAAQFLLRQLDSSTFNGDFGSTINFGLQYIFMGAGIYVFTYAMRRFIDRKSFASLGFNYKGYTDESSIGFFSAVAILGVGSLILVFLGYVTFLSVNIQVPPLLFELLLMIVVAFVEEVMFRGYLLNNLMQSTNKWIALAITAVLFAILHGNNPGITPYALVNIFLAGIFLGLNYIYTKNLWFGICFHFAWNFLQGPILGYDVSGLKLQSLFVQTAIGPPIITGGPFGFEGSILCPVLLALSVAGLAYGFSKKYLSNAYVKHL